ncbi:MAG: hypothetical protein MMC23_000657 [Stictis urceolatum]|nr:hypothetical protein [Stictis urceolata]
MGLEKSVGARSELQFLSFGVMMEWVRWAAHVPRRLITMRPHTPKGKELKSTSWLDGLRGFAALMVYFHHHQLWVHDSTQTKYFENSYGYDGGYYFAAFPFVRTFFSGGHYAVSTFFVISGYVLSSRPMGLIYADEHEKLLQAFSSALFRRWFRLFIPTLATTFLWMCSWHAFGWWCSPFEPQPTFWDELTKIWDEAIPFSYVFKGAGGFPWLYWNLHTWSIPFEFRGSLTVYITLLSLSMVTRKARFLCGAGLIFYLLYLVDGWYLAMFLSGMMLCEVDHLAARSELPQIFTKYEKYKKDIFLVLFVISVYLGGVPLATNNYDDLKKSPGWIWLSVFKPAVMAQHKWFYLFWGASLLITCVPRLPWLKDFFNGRFCQYLGKVSFSLYLMHGPVIWTLSDVVYKTIGWPRPGSDFVPPSYFAMMPLPRVGPAGLEPAFLLAHVVLLPATLWVSNIVTVLIDEPSVKFAGWLRTKALPQGKILL